MDASKAHVVQVGARDSDFCTGLVDAAEWWEGGREGREGMVWGEQRGYLKRRTATSKTFPYCCSHRSLTCTCNLDIN